MHLGSGTPYRILVDSKAKSWSMRHRNVAILVREH